MGWVGLSPYCHSFQELPVLSWDSEQLYIRNRSALWSQTHSVKAFCSFVSQEFQSGTTCALLTQSLGEALISSLQDSPASLGVVPVKEKAPKTRGGSGTKLSGSFARLSPDGSSWKTYQDSFPPADSPSFLGPWPRWGTMQNGVCSVPAEPVLPTSESASSSWPTPVATAYGNNQSGSPGAAIRESLDSLARTWPTLGWPTPAARDYKSGSSIQELHNSRPLSEECLNWRTPTNNDSKDSAIYANGELKLTGQAREWSTPTAQPHGLLFRDTCRSGLPDQTPGAGRKSLKYSGQLNANFVEWLMGLPLGHTHPSVEPDYELWAMQCRQLLRHLLGFTSGGL